MSEPERGFSRRSRAFGIDPLTPSSHRGAGEGNLIGCGLLTRMRSCSPESTLSARATRPRRFADWSRGGQCSRLVGVGVSRADRRKRRRDHPPLGGDLRVSRHFRVSFRPEFTTTACRPSSASGPFTRTTTCSKTRVLRPLGPRRVESGQVLVLGAGAIHDVHSPPTTSSVAWRLHGAGPPLTGRSRIPQFTNPTEDEVSGEGLTP